MSEKVVYAREWLRACGLAALNGVEPPPAPAAALLEHVEMVAQVECFKGAIHAMGLGHMAAILRQLVAVEAERDALAERDTLRASSVTTHAVRISGDMVATALRGVRQRMGPTDE